MYRRMRLIRRFEEQASVLYRDTKVPGFLHLSIGQEAVAVGGCEPLRTTDAVLSTHSGHHHCLAKGARPDRLMAELLGRADGYSRGRGGSMHVADLGVGIRGANGIVAAGAPFAAGAAWAGRRDGTNVVAATFFGDGGANQGVLHETMNLCTLWALPVLFVCENNGYAVTLAQEQSTAGSLVERAAAYGMAAEAVDGMDVDAVLSAASTAAARARAGEGPTFLECRTYRFFGHHTAERTMKLDYRTDEEIATWRLRDPLTLAGAHLDDGVRERIDDEVEDALDDAVAFARASALPDPDDALEFVYASGPRPRDGVAP